MRAKAAFFGAGLMDRYADIRFAILESGFGWLPFWAMRMQDQVDYMGYVPELRHTMREYMSGGRFFASIVLHEGPEMIKMVSGFLGNHVLMFSTDYPHPETRFPDSVDLVLGWQQLDDALLPQIMWDNAVRCFGEP
jgi:predicted TIM-barrel fold metal-dependent hydrolase